MMSFALTSRCDAPCKPDRGWSLSSLWKRLAPQHRSISRVDAGDLTDDVLRDIGLRDGRPVCRPIACNSAWQEAILTYPPRSL
ncbi:hypothetical protein [Rhizobium halophilum]|uniref:hypothetical protein n=1 Tax=Rhizobium halophilum TaxID=2846852 RepID=UPI001EFCB0BF|nr:hypothetical protein [Rhizobium halophilum]